MTSVALMALRPTELDIELIASDLAAAGFTSSASMTRSYSDLSELHVLVDPTTGLPFQLGTEFLLGRAVRNLGITSDSPRTYGESMLSWLRFLSQRNKTFQAATEEDLLLYRVNMVANGLSNATINLRMTVAKRFHRWAYKRGCKSPLGYFLINADKEDLPRSSRGTQRAPQILAIDQLNQIFAATSETYRLAFQWAAVAGLRRVELSKLRISDLPQPEELMYDDDGLVNIKINRKGGREHTVVVLVELVEKTNWFVLFERGAYESKGEPIFLNQEGEPISRQSLSREFARCARLIGSTATLHHLRHTYAVLVGQFLEASGGKRNTTKVLQTLLGHASEETVDIYLQGYDITSPALVSAMRYLFGTDVR